MRSCSQREIAAFVSPIDTQWIQMIFSFCRGYLLLNLTLIPSLYFSFYITLPKKFGKERKSNRIGRNYIKM